MVRGKRLLHINEIILGEILYSNWIRYVYSTPILGYNPITEEYKTINDLEKDKNGCIMVEGIYEHMVVGFGKSGTPYVFEVKNGLVLLERAKI